MWHALFNIQPLPPSELCSHWTDSFAPVRVSYRGDRILFASIAFYATSKALLLYHGASFEMSRTKDACILTQIQHS